MKAIPLLALFTFLLSACVPPEIPPVDQVSTSRPTELLATSMPTSQPTPTPESGIIGQALISPACPGPARLDTPCPDQPYQAKFAVLDQSEKPVMSFETDEEGRFRILLPPGAYILHPELEQHLPRADDQEVIVLRGEFTEIKVQFDSGMR